MRNEDVRGCSLCGEPLKPRSIMIGYKVTTQRLVVNVQNARSFAGLTTHFGAAGPRGAAALANIFAPGDVIEEPKELRDEFVICEECSDATIGLLIERVNAGGKDDEDRVD